MRSKQAESHIERTEAEVMKQLQVIVEEWVEILLRDEKCFSAASPQS